MSELNDQYKAGHKDEVEAKPVIHMPYPDQITSFTKIRNIIYFSYKEGDERKKMEKRGRGGKTTVHLRSSSDNLSGEVKLKSICSLWSDINMHQQTDERKMHAYAGEKPEQPAEHERRTRLNTSNRLNKRCISSTLSVFIGLSVVCFVFVWIFIILVSASTQPVRECERMRLPALNIRHRLRKQIERGVNNTDTDRSTKTPRRNKPAPDNQ